MNLAQTIFGDAYPLVDMHCHLDFAPDPAGYARAARATGVAAFSNTVTPQGFLATRTSLEAFDNVVVGVGLHPWWLADGRCTPDDVELAVSLVRDATFVGEVGLDFAPRREGTFDVQLSVFDRIVDACSQGGKALSIHAVRSCSAVLDVLERHGTTHKNACILHWFSGSSDELVRARELGCHFSFGTRMLQTKRGRAYARQVPPQRRLLETDLPDGDDAPPCSPQDWLDDLADASERLRLV